MGMLDLLVGQLLGISASRRYALQALLAELVGCFRFLGLFPKLKVRFRRSSWQDKATSSRLRPGIFRVYICISRLCTMSLFVCT